MSSEYKAQNVNSTYSITLKPTGLGLLQINTNATGMVLEAATAPSATPTNATNGTTPINCTVQIKDTTNIIGGLTNTASSTLTSQPNNADVNTLTGDAAVVDEFLTQAQLNDMLVRIVAEWHEMVGANCPIKNIFIKFTV